jgi:hypothetical protein
MLVLLERCILWRGCETRSHRSIEWGFQYKRKVWGVVMCSYTVTKSGWRGIVGQRFRVTEGNGRRLVLLIGRCIIVTIDDEFRKRS